MILRPAFGVVSFLHDSIGDDILASSLGHDYGGAECF